MSITTGSKEKYRLLTGSHTMDHKVYRSGVEGSDILELTKEQAESFNEGRLEKVSESEAEQEQKQPVTIIKEPVKEPVKEPDIKSATKK